MPPIIDHDACDRCGVCIKVCMEYVFGSRMRYPVMVLYPQNCKYCGACVNECAVQAVKLEIPADVRG